MSKLRCFVFTLNNPSPEEEKELMQLPDVDYVLFGREKGKENGTPHLQGYVELSTRKTLNQLKAMIPRAHIEPRRGSAIQAITYCKKDGDIYEQGKPRQQGKRKDIDEIREALEAGESVRSLLPRFSNYQQLKFAQNLIIYCEPPRDEPPRVFWFWGPAGTGKTRTAAATASLLSDDVYWTMPGLRWWQGYDGQTVSVFDDFRPTWAPIEYLLRLLDRHPLQIETKGSSRQCRLDTIFITCPQHPSTLYCFTDLEQLLRRISLICFFPEHK